MQYEMQHKRIINQFIVDIVSAHCWSCGQKCQQSTIIALINETCIHGVKLICNFKLNCIQ